ncbi:MAG: VanZ family protein, partial [Synergistaceae bacterium]|nr:VanZ family protein [Synergistaceae bacterium]
SFTSFRLYGLNLRHTVVLAFLLSSCVGLADECIKIYIPGREFDLVDWVLDVAGIIAGILTASMISILFRRGKVNTYDEY